jgi:hypothetical protein
VTHLIGDGSRAIVRSGRRRWQPALGLGIALLTLASAAAGQATSPTIDDLVAKAARQGTLRVIVELKMGPPGPPSPEAIARAQDLLLQELSGTSHRVLRRFTTIPFLGLEATAEALRRLGASPQVAGIREDRVLRPLGPPGSP